MTLPFVGRGHHELSQGDPGGTGLVCDETHTILVDGGLGPRRCVASTVVLMSQTLSRGPVSGTAVKANAAKRKPFLLDLYGTAVGKKYVMAITGLIGIGFVLTHMIGNLKMYLGVITEGDERVYDIDIYGEFLRELLVPILPRTYLLWGLRLRFDRRTSSASPRCVVVDPTQP